jgi:hypothetical protein
MTTTATVHDQLDQISTVLDTFCTDASNFDDKGELSERGGNWLWEFFDSAVAEIGKGITAGKANGSIIYGLACSGLLAKLKKGTPPHLSQADVFKMLMAHRVVSAAFEEEEAQFEAAMPTMTREALQRFVDGE